MRRAFELHELPPRLYFMTSTETSATADAYLQAEEHTQMGVTCGRLPGGCEDVETPSVRPRLSSAGTCVSNTVFGLWGERGGAEFQERGNKGGFPILSFRQTNVNENDREPPIRRNMNTGDATTTVASALKHG